MKTKTKETTKILARLKRLGITAYSGEALFKKHSKSAAFRKAYLEEQQRLDLVHQIKTLRATRRLTQKAVAAKSGMTQTVIARIESGEHAISLDTLGKIAHALGKKVALV